MKGRLAVVVVASMLGLGACTTAGSTPATAPPISEGTVVTPTALATPPTTEPAPTTTVDRAAEIEAIFQDLEVRRLQAIMDQDEEAFRAVFANDEYAERSMVTIAIEGVVHPASVVVETVEVFADTDDCIAAAVRTDTSQAIDGGGESDITDHVLEVSNGHWGLSWVGEGWRCDGPHPFSG